MQNKYILTDNTDSIQIHKANAQQSRAGVNLKKVWIEMVEVSCLIKLCQQMLTSKHLLAGGLTEHSTKTGLTLWDQQAKSTNSVHHCKLTKKNVVSRERCPSPKARHPEGETGSGTVTQRSQWAQLFSLKEKSYNQKCGKTRNKRTKENQ